MTTRFAEFLEADVAYMSKTRPEHDVAEVTEVVGRERVKGKAAILSDDLIVTGSTLISGARGAPRGGRDRGLRVRDARALPARRAGERSARAS